jgi:hypothetical protein
MKEIILTDEQARLITEATERVELRDAAGTLLFKIDPLDAKALANHRRRKLSGVVEKGIPGQDVQRYLQLLQAEWDASGPFDLNRAEQIFTGMNVREE